MKEQIKAPKKIQLSDKEIANLSDAEFKTLVIRMLTEMVQKNGQHYDQFDLLGMTKFGMLFFKKRSLDATFMSHCAKRKFEFSSV